MYENADYKIYRDLIFSVYLPVSKCHLGDNFMKKSLNSDCENFKMSNVLAQNIPGLKIYPSTARKSKSESQGEESKRISRKVDLNLIRSLNITLDLKNLGENVIGLVLTSI